MIQDFIRRHKPVMLIVVAAVALPFVFSVGYFGMGMGGPTGDAQPLGPVAVVEGQSIPAAMFADAVTDEVNRRLRMGADTEPEQLAQDGTGMELVENLVDRVILDLEAAGTGYTFSEEFLQQQLREAPDFQTNGEFDPEKWNAFLQRNRDMNWNQQYDALARQLRLQLVQQRAIASARVLESEIRKRFEQDNTQLRVRYASVSPSVELDEEAIREHYEDNIENYQDPARFQARFVAFSLDAPEPALANELVERARAGEDFAELAREHSDGPFQSEGGAFDWRPVEPSPPDHLATLYATETGAVSDPVRGPGGFYIYKVEQRTTDSETGAEQVKGRQIFLTAELTLLERGARQVRAERFAEQAEAEGFEAAAEAAGLEVERTGFFTDRANTIENVPSRDVFRFRQGVSALGLEAVSDPIEGNENIYVAQLTDTEPAVPQPFEEVREQVAEEAASAYKRTPAYQARLERLAEGLEEGVESLEELEALFPEADVQVAAAPPFTVATYRAGMQGAVWNARDVYEAVGYASPGTVNGPVYGLAGGFSGDPALFYVELLSKTPPTEETWEQFEEQREEIRQQLVASRQRQRYEDFMLAERNRRAWQLNAPVYEELLGLADTDEPAEDGEQPDSPSDAAEDTPAQDATAESSSDESAEAAEALPEASSDDAAPADEQAVAEGEASPEVPPAE